MLSMRELSRAVRVLRTFLPGNTLKRIVQSGDVSLVCICADSRRNKTRMLLSCDQEFARICVVEDSDFREVPAGSFHEFIRAHIAGAVIAGIAISDRNRQVGLELKSRTESWTLYVSILGSRSNMYLVDAYNRLVHSLRPLKETRRDLKIGDLWSEPAGSVPSAGVDRWKDISDDGYLSAIGKEYGRKEILRNAQQIARRITQVLDKERSMLGRKLTRLQEDLAKARLAETYRKKGELLKTVLHSVQPGDDSVTVTDYTTGETVPISLDPTLSPTANLEAYFARYQKHSRGDRIIQQQIGRLEEERDRIDSAEGSVKAALEKDPPDRVELERIESLPWVRRLISRYAPRQKKSAATEKQSSGGKIPARLRPKRYRTEDDLEIWVGKNDEGNDYLTTRMARGNDLFFHLEGYPGSHVILRTEGRTDPPSGSILDACELAVHFSKLKNAGSANVHIVPIKNVKKPKGAKPGLVYVRQGKTVYLKRNPDRLQNILASRIDG